MKDNQEKLIQHLIRFHILDYESCLQVLDTENTGDKVALSYVFRPLTKHKYIIKDKNGIVSILKKGKELFPNEEPLISIGGGTQSRNRILQVSKVAAMLEKVGVEITGERYDMDEPQFIPSARWRELRRGFCPPPALPECCWHTERNTLSMILATALWNGRYGQRPLCFIENTALMKQEQTE